MQDPLYDVEEVVSRYLACVEEKDGEIVRLRELLAAEENHAARLTSQIEVLKSELREGRLAFERSEEVSNQVVVAVSQVSVRTDELATTVEAAWKALPIRACRADSLPTAIVDALSAIRSDHKDHLESLMASIVKGLVEEESHARSLLQELYFSSFDYLEKLLASSAEKAVAMTSLSHCVQGDSPLKSLCLAATSISAQFDVLSKESLQNRGLVEHCAADNTRLTVTLNEEKVACRLLQDFATETLRWNFENWIDFQQQQQTWFGRFASQLRIAENRNSIITAQRSSELEQHRVLQAQQVKKIAALKSELRNQTTARQAVEGRLVDIERSVQSDIHTLKERTLKAGSLNRSLGHQLEKKAKTAASLEESLENERLAHAHTKQMLAHFEVELRRVVKASSQCHLAQADCEKRMALQEEEIHQQCASLQELLHCNLSHDNEVSLLEKRQAQTNQRITTLVRARERDSLGADEERLRGAIVNQWSLDLIAAIELKMVAVLKESGKVTRRLHGLERLLIEGLPLPLHCSS